MQYKIWSAHPPTLTKNADGKVRVHGGTVTKLLAGTREISVTAALPPHTTLANFEWQRPVSKIFQPEVRRVEGSKGKTYIIKSTPSGKWECNCTGYSFRRTCKHMGAVK